MIANAFSLRTYVEDNFDGMLVIGDVHSDYGLFEKAVNYAKKENYFLFSLGDLVDRGENPYEVVELMYKLVQDARAGMNIGNHDDKFRRFSTGAKVQFSKDAKRTIELVGTERFDRFMEMYLSVMNDSMFSSYYHKFGDIVMVHAASHPTLWESEVNMDKSAKARFIVGETNGEVYDDGYPVRLYNWMEEVPIGKTLIVGHDKMPIHNIEITEPMVILNKSGGKVIFLDTGCGKGGFLSGAIITHKKGKFTLQEFLEFKDQNE